jgi:hypothetical protein
VRKRSSFERGIAGKKDSKNYKNSGILELVQFDITEDKPLKPPTPREESRVLHKTESPHEGKKQFGQKKEKDEVLHSDSTTDESPSPSPRNQLSTEKKV